MKLDTLVLPQSTQHYSLMSLMYGHQYNQQQDVQMTGLQGLEDLQRQDLVSHIADFCDCV